MLRRSKRGPVLWLLAFLIALTGAVAPATAHATTPSQAPAAITRSTPPGPNMLVAKASAKPAAVKLPAKKFMGKRAVVKGLPKTPKIYLLPLWRQVGSSQMGKLNTGHSAGEDPTLAVLTAYHYNVPRSVRMRVLFNTASEITDGSILYTTAYSRWIVQDHCGQPFDDGEIQHFGMANGTSRVIESPYMKMDRTWRITITTTVAWRLTFMPAVFGYAEPVITRYTRQLPGQPFNPFAWECFGRN